MNPSQKKKRNLTYLDGDEVTCQVIIKTVVSPPFECTLEPLNDNLGFPFGCPEVPAQ